MRDAKLTQQLRGNFLLTRGHDDALSVAFETRDGVPEQMHVGGVADIEEDSHFRSSPATAPCKEPGPRGQRCSLRLLSDLSCRHAIDRGAVRHISSYDRPHANDGVHPNAQSLPYACARCNPCAGLDNYAT